MSQFLHWNYYIALESDLAKISRFVEFSKDNYSTFSIELAHIILATSSEIDVVLKKFCNLVDPEKLHKNINDYRVTISEKFPELINEKCFINRYGLELEPWKGWADGNNPAWWRSYNNVKHERDEFFKEASLENAINSVSALSLVLIYYYKYVFSQENAVNFKVTTERLKPSPCLIEFNDGYVYQNIVV